ncbi:hypothetical protein DVH24_015647 [Malus domestica]|uniref:Ferredoxin n=1 Tax=Malus domestica TaxID=3750 RepID=A0A498HN98_MALDO|nr:hypothetical protein DVH24_015647 [Malus domestica]
MAYPSTRISVMDHAIPCNPCISLSIHLKPPPFRQISWPNTVTHHSNITKWRRNTTSELQTPVAVTDRTGDCSPSVPTHKVTVHDRQRGVSHQFLVPEGYALLCVGYPSSDLEVETQEEDEVYWLQFGRYFARGPIERDDYALELAMGDE